MATAELTIKRREGTGKEIAKRLRRAGAVPAILYGGTKTETVSLDPKAVLRMIHGHEGTTQLLTLKFEGETGNGARLAIIRELQFDPVSDALLHVDLQEVSADRAITVRVAVRPVGEAAGVRDQKGILNLVLHELEVSCLPTAIPQRIDADVSALMIGNVLTVRELVALGNPGPEYRDTRHNVGQRVLDSLARTLGKPWRRDGAAVLARGQWRGAPLCLIKPQAFMNACGPVVAKALRRVEAGPAELILVYDDIDLPLGTVRIRMKGSHGGHNGVRSVIEALGTQEIRRVKVGVGRPDSKDDVPDH